VAPIGLVQQFNVFTSFNRITVATISVCLVLFSFVCLFIVLIFVYKSVFCKFWILTDVYACSVSVISLAILAADRFSAW